jgi:hypothetical protein
MKSIDRVALRRRAEAVLRQNDRGTYTVASPESAPLQFAVASAVAAVGWATFDPRRAVTELESLMWSAWADGRIPHVAFHGGGDPTDDAEARDSTHAAARRAVETDWGSTVGSCISAPPLTTLAARRVHELGGDPNQLRALVPRFDANHRWFLEHRDPNDWGCVVVAHRDESLFHDCPGLDPTFKNVTEANIAEAMVAKMFGPASFAVYDPGCSALLAAAEDALADLSAALGDVHPGALARSRKTKTGLRYQLYDPVQARYHFQDPRGGRSHCPDTIAAYLPIIVDDVPGRDPMLRSLKSRLAANWPVPTVSPTDGAFKALGGSRGGVMPIANWLLAPTLGPELVERSLQLMDDAGFREYYDPRNGTGYGANHSTIAAAVCLDWLESGA